MSGFSLVPVSGGDPIHLSVGVTVLGRGPLLGVSDKRVSRHHGLLENLNGQLRLKATHLNPCFVQSSPTDEPRPLQKDSWQPLHHGDLFSLLPGQFIFRVEAEDREDLTPRNSQMVEEGEEELSVSPKPFQNPAPSAGPGPGPCSPPKEQNGKNRSERDGSAQPETMKDDHREASPSLSRRRVLPAWMISAAGAIKNSPPSQKVQSVQRSKKAAAAPSRSQRAAAKQIPDQSEEEEEEERPRKRRRTSDEEAARPKADLSSEDSSARNQSGPGRSEGSEESDSVSMEVEEDELGNAKTTSGSRESEKGNRKSEPPQTTKQEPAEVDGSNAGSASASEPEPGLRSRCPYGKDCYRKNPIHFQECSHPGDPDYEEEEEEEEETDRPECPYGTDCYRKNPLHRKEFKHTKKPARATRTVMKKVEDEGEDEDDYDDSFINDDSEDAGNDSDYVPPASDDSDKEDVRRLQTEAKEFLKRRK